MELMLFLRIFVRSWWLVLIPVVITAAVSLPAMLRRDPAVSGGYTTSIRYSAAQQLDAIPNRDGDYQDVWLASELTVNAFTDWVRTNSFQRATAEEAAERGLTIDPAAIAVAADNQRSVGLLVLSWPNAEELAIIADAAIEALRTRNEMAFPQLGGAPAQVTILDEPVIVASPPPLADRFGPLVRIGLGLVAGMALALLAHYLDPVARRREDVEAAGVRVISAIPRR